MEPTPTVDELRRIDIAVAEKVLGCRVFYHPTSHGPSCGCGASHFAVPDEYGDFEDGNLSHYSTEIAAAWTVYLAIMDKPFSKRQAFYAALQGEASRIAELPTGDEVAWPDVFTVLRKDFPAAICRAALAVVSASP